MIAVALGSVAVLVGTEDVVAAAELRWTHAALTEATMAARAMNCLGANIFCQNLEKVNVENEWRDTGPLVCSKMVAKRREDEERRQTLLRCENENE